MIRHKRVFSLRLEKTLSLLAITLVFAAPAHADLRGSTASHGDASSLDLRLAPEDIKALPTESRPDFTGLWVLDRKSSDDPKEVLKAARPGRGDFPGPGGFPGPGSGPGGFGGGPGPGGRPPGRPPDGGPMGRGGPEGFGPMPDLFADQLDIVQWEPLIEITTARHGKRVIYTDHPASSVSAMGSQDQRGSTGGWEGNRLVIETTTAGGRQTIQRFRLLTEPRRLELTTELPAPGGQGNSIKVKQVFLPK